jgi:hypothetical protein
MLAVGLFLRSGGIRQRQNPELRTLIDPSLFSLAATAKIAPGHFPRTYGGRAEKHGKGRKMEKSRKMERPIGRTIES